MSRETRDLLRALHERVAAAKERLGDDGTNDIGLSFDGSGAVGGIGRAVRQALRDNCDATLDDVLACMGRP